MPVVRKVTAVWARQIADLLEARQRPVDMILQEVGLARAELASPEAQIAFAKHAALIEAAAEHLKDTSFGLHFGASLDPLDAGAIAYLAANSPTLQAAVDNYIRYLSTTSEGFHARLAREGRHAILTLEAADLEMEPSQQCYEFALAAALNICRFVIGRRITPYIVEMKHRRKSGFGEFRSYFGAAVVFGADRYAIALDPTLLAAPCRSADPRLFRIVKAYCDELLGKSRQAADFRGEVENLVGSLLPTGTATTTHVASTLGMSERTLSRRLAEEGVTFRAIVEQQRQRMAFRYLGDPAIRPTQIAYLLGYSEPSAFSHAFRRWTGQSPAEYRAKGLGSSASAH